MFQPRVIIMILLVGIGLFVIGNVDTTPEPNVTTYSSSAHDYANPLPVIVAPVNPDTVPDSAPPKDVKSSDRQTDGDDNGDGRIDEDESGWDCRSMGNGICGPGATITAEDGSQVPVSFYND